MENIPILRDITFWHLLATTASTALIWIIKIYLSDQKEILKDLVEVVNKLSVDSEVSKVKQHELERRVDKLESN